MPRGLTIPRHRRLSIHQIINGELDIVFAHNSRLRFCLHEPVAVSNVCSSILSRSRSILGRSRSILSQSRSTLLGSLGWCSSSILPRSFGRDLRDLSLRLVDCALRSSKGFSSWRSSTLLLRGGCGIFCIPGGWSSTFLPRASTGSFGCGRYRFSSQL